MLALSALSSVAARTHFLSLTVGISVVCLSVIETVEIGLLDSGPLTINVLNDPLTITVKSSSVSIDADTGILNITEKDDALAIRKC